MKKKGVLAVIRVTVLAIATGGWLGCASAKTAKDLQYNHEFYEIIIDESFFIEEPYDYLTVFYKDEQKALEIEVNEACGYCGSTSSILTNMFGIHGEVIDVEEDTI